MPLTFPTLVSLIPDDINADVNCYDEGIEDIPDQINADLVGITVITGTAKRAYQLADRFRREGKTVVLGGPHITLIPDEAQTHADSIVVGYAEDEWPRLLRDYSKDELKSRYTQAPELQLGGYPLPQRQVLPRFKYLTQHVFEATRSCIFACEFCVAPSAWGSQPLQKPVQEIVDDMRQLNTKKAIFVDLNLTSNRDYALSLFAALKPLKIQWFGLSTTLICRDMVLLDAAAGSGCRGLLMGLESINSKNLKSMRKGFNRPQDYAQVVTELHQRDIALQGCFVFGLDEDGLGIFEQTAQFAIDVKIDLPRFAIVTPFPGTPFYRKLQAQNRIIDFDWERYDGQHAVFQPRNMSAEELQQGTSLAWKKAYSWPSIMQRLSASAAPLHIALLTNLGYRHYAYKLDKFYTCDWPGALVSLAGK
jgi:radical SAM superfamily enzyme YgiQ (UPF0313 family)